MSSANYRGKMRLLDVHRDRHARRLWVSGPSNDKCVLLCFIKSVLGSRYGLSVLSRASKGGKKQPRVTDH